MPAETSQTLDRGLRVLGLLASSPDGLSVADLAARLGVHRTIVHRLVTTLEQHALVRRDGRGRLHVGLGVLRLAAAVQPVLRDLAGPVLRGLAEQVGCTAHLTVADGEEALALAVVEPSWTDFHVGYRVGSRHPLSRGAAGRAILLGRGRGRGRGPDEAGGGTGHAPGHAPDGETGAAAYAVTAGELQPGARGLAAPVLGVEGLEASVGVVTLGDLDADTLGPVVARAAADLASRLQVSPRDSP